MKEYLDKFMAWLSASLAWLPKLGGGKQWEISGKVIKLWPFVATLLVILILATVSVI